VGQKSKSSPLSGPESPEAKGNFRKMVEPHLSVLLLTVLKVLKERVSKSSLHQRDKVVRILFLLSRPLRGEQFTRSELSTGSRKSVSFLPSSYHRTFNLSS
jgi:hypothetical protein